jgi:hypothetical protein
MLMLRSEGNTWPVLIPCPVTNSSLPDVDTDHTDVKIYQLNYTTRNCQQNNGHADTPDKMLALFTRSVNMYEMKVEDLVPYKTGGIF